MLQDLRLGGGNQTGKTDAVFAGLGAFNASSGVMYTNGDEIQRAHWVVAELQQAGPDATELPNEVLRFARTPERPPARKPACTHTRTHTAARQHARTKE